MSDNQFDKIDNSVKPPKLEDQQNNAQIGNKPHQNTLLDELKFKFSYLNDLKPDDAKSRIESNEIVDDNFVHKLNPARFAFYQEFIRELNNNPELLKKIIYENKMIKYKKEDEDKIIENIINNLEGLYRVSESNALQNDGVYIESRKNKIKTETENIKGMLGKILLSQNTLDTGYENQENQDHMNKEKQNIVEQTFTQLQPQTGGNQPDNKAKIDIIKRELRNPTEKEKYTKNIDDMKTKFKENSLLEKFSNQLSQIYNNETTENKVKAMKLKDVVSEIEQDKFTSINSLNISKEDRFLFIGVTFLIRLLSLGIIDWSLSTNFVLSFTSAFVLYIMIYSLFILLILISVNVQYQVPIGELYNSEHSLFTAISGSMYYFYMRPGHFFSSITRFIAHLGIIVSITTIAILIKDKDQQKGNLNYNYAEKKKIRKSVHNFTLLMWVFTSAIAMYL